jgi:hypothetical protein
MKKLSRLDANWFTRRVLVTREEIQLKFNTPMTSAPEFLLYEGPPPTDDKAFRAAALKVNDIPLAAMQ